MSSSSSPEPARRPYYVIMARMPAALEVIGASAQDVNETLEAMARTGLRHSFALPNDVILTINLQQVAHWTVTPERPKDVVIVPVVLS
jgi:hypothetical protein